MPMYIGLDGPPSSMRIVKTSIDVANASSKRPRGTDMLESSWVSILSGPGRRAFTKPDAAIAAITWATVVWMARSQRILPVM